MLQKRRAKGSHVKKTLSSVSVGDSQCENLEANCHNEQKSKSFVALSSFSGNISISSISVSLVDDVDDVANLRKKLEEAEVKHKMLLYENTKLHQEMEEEKKKVVKLQKKLEFVKENQDVFMRLKEAYINMKYNEAAGKKMIEIKERAQQTYENIVCRCCLETEQTRRDLLEVQEKYKDALILSDDGMKKLITTTKYLRDLMDRREKSWALNMEREGQYHTHISALEKENEALKELLKSKYFHPSELSQRLSEESIAEGDQDLRRYIKMYKKIIIKLEKRFRELLQQNTITNLNCSLMLNEKERSIVNRLISKYLYKLNKSSIDLTENPNDEVKLSECSAPLPAEKAASEGTENNNENELEIDTKAEKAIFEMDFLFEST